MVKPSPAPGRTPPHSIQAEEGVIACALIDGPDVITKALDAKVCEESFYIPANRLIWRYLCSMLKRGLDLSLPVLAEDMKKQGHLDEIGGYAYLTRVTTSVPTTAQARFFIEKVQELYTLRLLIKAGTKTVEDAYTHTGDFAVFATQVEEALRVREGLEKPKTWEQATDDTLALMARLQNGEKVTGYPWPWVGMDDRLDAAEGGELIIIGARPGRGKSSIARQVAWNWSEEHNWDVAYFSREMPIGQLPQLFAQSLCGYSWRDARKGRLHARETAEFTQCLRDRVKTNKRLHIYDKDSTVSQICARIKSARQTKDLKAVFVDYLQAYDMEQIKGETRDIAIGRFTRAMKDIALDLNIPVILLAQLSRSVTKEEREPRDSDLRESGNVEQDADRIIFSHWLTQIDGVAIDINDFTLPKVPAQFIQVKNRNGTAGKLDVVFHRPTTTFKSATT